MDALMIVDGNRTWSSIPITNHKDLILQENKQQSKTLLRVLILSGYRVLDAYLWWAGSSILCDKLSHWPQGMERSLVYAKQMSTALSLSWSSWAHRGSVQVTGVWQVDIEPLFSQVFSELFTFVSGLFNLFGMRSSNKDFQAALLTTHRHWKTSKYYIIISLYFHY